MATTGKKTLRAFVGEWSMPIMFVAMVVVLAVATGGVSLKKNNLLNLLSQNSIVGILAIGQFLVILTGGIDLSVGSVLMASSIAYVYYQPLGVGGSMVFAVLVGMFFGLFNALCITKLRINPFITTLASMQIARGFGFISVNGQPIFNIRPEFLKLGSTKIFQVSAQAYVWAALAAVGVFLLWKTALGVKLYCVGGSPAAARLSGVKSDRVVTFAYMASGALCGIGGILYTSRLELADPIIGGTLNMDSITAVVIGGTSLAGGQGKLTNVIVGVFILGMLNNLMNIMGVPSTMHVGIKGCILVAMVLLNNASLGSLQKQQ